VTSTPEITRVDGGHYGPVGRSEWMDIDWREHQRWVEVAGRPVNVIDMGSGERTIVFVHGLSGAWVNWLENIPFFARDHRVIAMDLPGFGHSPMPAEPISMKGYGAIVDELLDRLGVDRAAFVGNSMGGFISAEVAISFETRVEQLVLVSAAGLSTENLRNDRVMAALARADELLIFWGSLVGSRADWLTRRPRGRLALTGAVFAHPELLPAPLLAEQVRASGKRGFVPALDALTSYPIRDRLAKIRAPTLIVWGDRDRLVPPRDAADFQSLIDGSRVIMYRDTGHCAMLERPDAFNDAVAAFLEEEPRTTTQAGSSRTGSTPAGSRTGSSNGR
jgi:pimeloyl-ACP methyl ester carboxylesterase